MNGYTFKENFKNQVWAAAYGAAFVKYRSYKESRAGQEPQVFSSRLSDKMCCHLACDVADKAVKALDNKDD